MVGGHNLFTYLRWKDLGLHTTCGPDQLELADSQHE